MINVCNDRYYDLCIKEELIRRLKLNGYIGIASKDSISDNKRNDILLNILKSMPIESLIQKSCVYNNNIYTHLNDVNTYVDNMKNNRTYGIPEIVLIPYDIHTYPSPQEYSSIYRSINESTDLNTIDHSHFIFRHECHVDGLNSIDIAKQMERVIADKYLLGTVIGKSKQAPILFTLLLSEVDETNKDYVKNDLMPWEKSPMEKLVFKKNMTAYKHFGFWQCMDTLRDKCYLEELWRKGNAPWKIWKK
jgi:hypothetical protein